MKLIKISLLLRLSNLNLKKTITYYDISNRFFEDTGFYRINSQGWIEYFDSSYENNFSYPLNSFSKEQCSKIILINKLINIATYLNDGWVPDWNNMCEPKFVIGLSYNKLQINRSYNRNDTFVYFKTREIALQAIEILGENEIIKIYN